jgi:hypothetical protein
MPLAMSGVGQELRNAMEARTEHLATDGLVPSPGDIVPQHALLATLRCRRLDAVGASLSNEIRMPYSPPRSRRAGRQYFRQRLTLNSGRFALIDNGLGFALVPWTPALDRHLGHRVAGVAKESGGIEWSFDAGAGWRSDRAF